MSHPLFLTTSEQQVFDALSAPMQEGWELQRESQHATRDTPEHQWVRLSLLRLHDPLLKDLQRKALSVTSSQEMAELMCRLDFSRIPEDDLLELVFALGAGALSEIIAELLKKASRDDDLLGVASLTFLRHELFLTSRRSS